MTTFEQPILTIWMAEQRLGCVVVTAATTIDLLDLFREDGAPRPLSESEEVLSGDPSLLRRKAGGICKRDGPLLLKVGGHLQKAPTPFTKGLEAFAEGSVTLLRKGGDAARSCRMAAQHRVSAPWKQSAGPEGPARGGQRKVVVSGGAVVAAGAHAAVLENASRIGRGRGRSGRASPAVLCRRGRSGCRV